MYASCIWMMRIRSPAAIVVPGPAARTAPTFTDGLPADDVPLPAQ
jgi:hypothetical protein